MNHTLPTLEGSCYIWSIYRATYGRGAEHFEPKFPPIVKGHQQGVKGKQQESFGGESSECAALLLEAKKTHREKNRTKYLDFFVGLLIKETLETLGGACGCI